MSLNVSKANRTQLKEILYKIKLSEVTHTPERKVSDAKLIFKPKKSVSKRRSSCKGDKPSKNLYSVPLDTQIAR